MAWTQQLPSGKHRAMYRDADKRQRSAGTYASVRKAREAANAAEIEARNPDTARPQPQSTMTWQEWEPEWMRRRQVAPSTLHEDAKRIEKHVRPKWGDIRLVDIKRSAIQSWIDDLSADGLSPSTVQKVQAVLSASLSAAMRLDIIPSNPAQGVQKPAISPADEHWLTVDEEDAVRDVIDERHRFMFELLIRTGMRWGEAVALHWSDVDLDGRTIEVAWGYDNRSNSMGPPKTKQKRVIPIGDVLVSRLGERLDEMGRGSAPIGVDYLRGVRPEAGLVARPAGSPSPPNPQSFRAALTAAGNAAFVGEGSRRRRVGKVRVHDLRHSYASRLVQNGVSIVTVSKLLGHANLTVTQRYAVTGSAEWEAVRGVFG